MKGNFNVDTQTMINALLGLVAFLGGWFVHSFQSQLKDNKGEIKETKDRLPAVEVLVAGKYPTRDELKELVLDRFDTIQQDIRSCMLQKRRKDDKHEP